MPQPKDIDWLNGYKNKTHLYAAYKGLTSTLDVRTHRLKVNEWKKIFHANENPKKTGVATAYLRDIAGSGSENNNELNNTKNQVTQIFLVSQYI